MTPERIVQARQMLQDGKFRRKITSREPDDLSSDRITLECGHHSYCSSIDEDQDRNCRTCAEEWIRQSGEQGGRHGRNLQA